MDTRYETIYEELTFDINDICNIDMNVIYSTIKKRPNRSLCCIIVPIIVTYLLNEFIAMHFRETKLIS